MTEFNVGRLGSRRILKWWRTSQLAYCSHSFLGIGLDQVLDSEGFEHVHVSPGLPDPFFKLFSFPTSILVKLLEVFYALPRSTKLRFLPLLCLSHRRE